MMRNIKIAGYGTYIPDTVVTFKDQTRHRVMGDETLVDMATKAVNSAMENANLKIEDIDLIVSTSAVGAQPIPCTAALIHERVAKGTAIPALDINTTCTSFISGLDIISHLVQNGSYNRVLIVAADLASRGLNKDQKESYELFADGAAAIIIEKTDDVNKGIVYSMQRTWSEGAHLTEIRGGLSNYTADKYNGDNYAEYLFDMKGHQILRLTADKIEEFFKEFYEKGNLSLEDIDIVVPHQASKALSLIMRRLNIPKGKYIDIVKDYGNMVSASVPYALCYGLENKLIKENDTVMLCGTAAGLTINALVIRL